MIFRFLDLQVLVIQLLLPRPVPLQVDWRTQRCFQDSGGRCHRGFAKFPPSGPSLLLGERALGPCLEEASERERETRLRLSTDALRRPKWSQREPNMVSETCFFEFSETLFFDDCTTNLIVFCSPGVPRASKKQNKSTQQNKHDQKH